MFQQNFEKFKTKTDLPTLRSHTSTFGLLYFLVGEFMWFQDTVITPNRYLKRKF